MTTDDLAEHAVAAISYTGREVDGICCASPECAEGDLAIEFPDMDAFAAHQAAIIAAAGWVRLEDLIEWFETEDPEPSMATTASSNAWLSISVHSKTGSPSSERP